MNDDEVRQIEPEDDEITEEWIRETDEPEIRAVSAHHVDSNEDGDGDSWYVSIWAQEFFRRDPLGLELRQRIQAALLAVAGVTDAGEHDNETWHVEGTPSGEALTRAAASVVDDMADRLREG
jgi:hypothetical protein